MTAGLSGVLRGHRREPRVDALRRSGFRRLRPSGAVSSAARMLTSRSGRSQWCQQLIGGGQQPLAEHRGGGVAQCAVDDFDHQDEPLVGHVSGEHDREVGETFHRGRPERHTGAGQLVARGHAAGREVLVDQQRVVHLADAAHRPQLRVSQIAVLTQHRRITLHCKALLTDRGAGVESHPQRDGVDEQADHGFDAGQFGGPAGYGDPEHHVGRGRSGATRSPPRPSAAACSA